MAIQEVRPTLRKRSPRYPSISLEFALGKVLNVYSAEGRHPAPIDVVAQHMGYKSANNGSALSAIASTSYYTLLDRPKEGFLAVSREVENYKFAPSESDRSVLLEKWLRAPQIFADLLDTYPGKLPSEANLKFDLIQRGFSPVAADECLRAFVASVEFSGYYTAKNSQAVASGAEEIEAVQESQIVNAPAPPADLPAKMTPSYAAELDGQQDRIPIRLPGNRRAWLIVPSPFYEADKKRINAQIDLLLTDDDEEEKE